MASKQVGLLLCALLGCGKTSGGAVPDAGHAVPNASVAPASTATSPWLERSADGGYAIRAGADCNTILAGSPPELASAPAPAALGVRALLPEPDTVTIPSLGLRARLPRAGSARLAPDGTDFLRTSGREWESAYAALLDQALPFDGLVFHWGEEPWTEGVSFTSLAARLYAVTDSVDRTVRDLEARLRVAGARVVCADRKGHWSPGSPLAKVTTGTQGPWRTVRTTMSLWYGDYGGNGVVELLVRRAGDVTIVLAFMFEERSRAADRAAIADAFAVEVH